MPPTMKRPHAKIGWWRWKWLMLKRMRSPLRLRGSIVRLRHRNKHPYLALLRLCLPTISLSWSFPIPEPLPPMRLVDDPQLCWTRRCEGDLKNLQAIPIWCSRDTPLRSLYRLYEAIMAGDDMYAVIQYELEYFWYQSGRLWELHRIPDPRDSNPIRYAIIACIVEAMPASFNFKLSIGMRRDENNVDPTESGYAPYEPVAGPMWTKHVPPVDKQYLRDVMPERMLDSQGRLVLHEEADSEIFNKRNLVASEGMFYRI
ncbi:hypothetical protein GX50_08052 [[Emmonsia] crescens]|uniref:Uncharacterized protein n=1 Tax=[Emmonsia] crescens TaxID=73230 RepID=A0A2B7Z8S8_9EURO|nr:hypothetical protein GX50_08052 [Emmonsia crescens]